MKKSQWLFVVLLLLASSAAMAQKKVITGKVTNQATGEPLSGVNILVDKQKGGTTSKLDGTYSISVDTGSINLIFSYVGFTSQIWVIGEKTMIDVSLVPAVVTNDEVVVVGYGTQKKSHLTGAISKYKNERLDE